jgi:hypothetical protein
MIRYFFNIGWNKDNKKKIQFLLDSSSVTEGIAAAQITITIGIECNNYLALFIEQDEN